jgi:carbon monoxide dehydrogenase subunit G
VGSTRRARVKTGLMTTENDAVVTVYEPPNRAVMKGTSENASFEADLRFVAVEGGTRVNATIEMFLTGPAKLFGPMFIRWYDKNWNQGMANLKRMMESGEL